MKWQAVVAACMAAVGAMLCQANARAAGNSDARIQSLAAQIRKTGSGSQQRAYSKLLHQSVNAAVMRNLEQRCSSANRGPKVQTFSLVGTMRLDGVLTAPVPLPDNGFTRCMVAKMDSVTFPLPPGNQRGWPVAIQFDGRSGRVLYVSGDRQRALPRYRTIGTSSMPWVYTPVPRVPSGFASTCKVSVWLSVNPQGRVQEVDPDESTCPSSMKMAVVEAASQWIYVGTPGTRHEDSMDVRLEFGVKLGRVRVNL